MLESYTESLQQLNTSISALNDCLVSQQKSYPDSCSVIATGSNAVLEENEFEHATVGKPDNLDTPQQPE